MVPAIDIYRSAWVLIEEYGDDAPIWVAQKADAMLERGNLDGERLWLSILAAIEELQAKVRPAGTVVQKLARSGALGRG